MTSRLMQRQHRQKSSYVICGMNASYGALASDVLCVAFSFALKLDIDFRCLAVSVIFRIFIIGFLYWSPNGGALRDRFGIFDSTHKTFCVTPQMSTANLFPVYSNRYTSTFYLNKYSGSQ
uniref:Uncharacterized protein n=1 Tax=Glossina brevipalpis TaxID=37001 RepID=A0A1A9W2Q0_9MUSC